MRCLIRFLTRGGAGAIETRERIFEGEALTLGRATDQILHLKDKRVALEHARITKRGADLLLMSLAPAGVIVNGSVVREARLAVGDAVQIGANLLKVIAPPAGFDLAFSFELDPATRADEMTVSATQLRIGDSLLGMRSWSWLLFLLVLALALMIPASGLLDKSWQARLRSTVLPADTAWTVGPLASVHHVVEAKCESCHERPFVPVRDQACLACHGSRLHEHAREFMKAGTAIGESRCTDCHREHDGSAMLVKSDDRTCARCHGSLRSVAGPEVKAADARDFLTAHPDFRVTMLVMTETTTGNSKPAWHQGTLRGLPGDPQVHEDSGLVFEHDKHLNKNGIRSPVGDVVLSCADCHRPEPGGARMQPINMERDCEDCHRLDFDPADPGRMVPHGDPAVVLDTLVEYYSKRYLQGFPDPLAKAGPASGLQRPGLPLTAADREAALRRARVRAGDVARDLFERRACGVCHEVSRIEGAPGSPGWSVRPVVLTQSWMPDAHFDHERHGTDLTPCASCHAAGTSKDTRDILMPPIRVCRDCHAGSDVPAGKTNLVASGCMSCHSFHRDTQPLWRASADGRSDQGGSRAVTSKLATGAMLLAVTLLGACGGGSRSSSGAAVDPAGSCDGSCASAATFLATADVEQVIARAVAEAQARTAPATIAVVDRVGNVLGVFRMTGAATSVTVTSGATPAVSGGLDGVTIVPDTLAAIAKAITAAYLSSEGNAFSTRTASQIVQQHFNPGENLAPGGPLFGVQFSQLPCSDTNSRYAGGPPDAGPKRSPLGLAADPGGFPLYKGGTPFGAVGVVADGVYGLDRNVSDRDQDLDELIALGASYGLAAPDDRLADRITADGKTLRFSDARFSDLLSDPPSAPPFSAIDVVAGALTAVPGYAAAVIQGGMAFGTPASGIRADTLDFPGLDAFVLVDDADVERFPPRAGSETPALLSATEVRELLRQALATANRARAQIRRPLNSPARVSIAVVDTSGVPLGVVRSRDAPMFGIDVAIQKARTAAFFSSPAAAGALTGLPPAVYTVDAIVATGSSVPGDYVSDLRSFLGLSTALADGGVAFSARAIGNLARPFYPDGVDGTAAGPLSKLAGSWSVFSTGVQLDLAYNAIIQHVAFVRGAVGDVGTNCTGVSGFDSGFVSSAPVPGLANGIQIFPGSVPVYRDHLLIGAVGVSGDGVDQDDMVAFLGVHETGAALGTLNNAPADLRSDVLTPSGARLRYVNCPQAPFLNSSEQEACGGL